MESNSVQSKPSDDLDDNLDESLNILENHAKAKDNNATRVTVVKNVVLVGVTTAFADETVLQEPDPDAKTEFKTNVKAEEYEDPENTSLETLKLNTIAKLEKLIHVRKVETNVDNAIIIDKHGFDKEHYYCVLAKVLVVIIITKHMHMLANYSQLMNEKTRLDIYKILLSFPWRPGDLLCWCVYFAMMNVFVLQLMYVLMQSQVYSVMNTSGYKVCTEVEPLHSQPILPVLLLDTTNLDLDEEELDNMQVDQTASADTLMVLLTLLS